MDEMIKKFIALCVRLENDYPGLTNYVYDIKCKQLESTCEQAYYKNDLVSFSFKLNELRGYWMTGVDRFQRRGLNV